MGVDVDFIKAQAYGNSFVVVSEKSFCGSAALNKDTIKFLCDSNYGIGCDQMLVICCGLSASKMKHHLQIHNKVKVTIYNKDGSLASTCGNGLKCLAQIFNNACHNTKKITFVSQANHYICHIMGNNIIKVDMGSPIISDDVVKVGNLHKIVQVSDKEEINYKGDDEMNVNYVTKVAKDELFVTNVERGAGKTLSCGSGSSASAVFFMQNGLISGNTVKIKTAGCKGDEHATIEWNKNQDYAHVFLIGACKVVFRGTICL